MKHNNVSRNQIMICFPSESSNGTK